MGVRTYRDVPRVYLDMDGPLANFDAACAASGLPPHHFKMMAGSYLALPLVDGALAAIQFIENLGLDVFILSKAPSKNPYSATEKLLWVKQTVPHLLDRVILSADKGAVGTSRDFLVDDHPEWANANNFPGTILTYTGDWTAIKRQLVAELAKAPQ